MHSRRRLLAAAAGFVASFRFALAEPRGVYDLSVWVTTHWPLWVYCENPTVQRNAGVAAVEMVCHTARGAKIPKRGAQVMMEAHVEYADTQDEIGICGAITRIKKAGSVTLACDVSLPDEPVLPIVIEGDGTGVAEVFALPGGSLRMDTTVSILPDHYGRIEMKLSSGYSVRLWESYPYAEHTESHVEQFDAGSALIESSVPGPWRVVISEAFPS